MQKWRLRLHFAVLQLHLSPFRSVVISTQLGRYLSCYHLACCLILLPSHSNPTLVGLSGQSLHTSLALDSHSVFKSYSHSGAYASDVTVNLKDLKALVGLCVEMGVDVGLRFDAPGVPLLAVPHVRGVQVRGRGGRGEGLQPSSEAN